MIRYLRTTFLASFLILSTGACSSIINGTTQQIGVSSAPSGAHVFVNNMPSGATPTVVQLKRGDNHIIRLEMEGYEPLTIPVTRSVSGWIAGNIIFGGLIGIVVDAATGAMYKLSPEQATGTLAKQVVASEDGDMILVTLTRSPDPSWEKIGQLTAVR